MIFEYIKKGIDNFRFALNLDDYIPEHIRQELMKQIEYKDEKVIHEAGELVIDKHNEQEINKFNSKIEQISPGKAQELSRQRSPEERFFSEIEGYNDIKKLMMRCIVAPDPTHVILDGPPASGKTIFLLSMQKGLDNSYFVDCTNATGAGMVDYLFSHDVKYLLLDEVEKMSKKHQNVLLNLMETGILTSTKVKKTYEKEMNVSIFATTNDVEAISKPLRSRFLEFSLPEYTFEEFDKLAVKLLGERYGHRPELAHKVSDVVWNKILSRDCRDILQVGKLSKSISDVEFVATTLRKYKRKHANRLKGEM
jgi:replication-associated recombination protein RarA